MNFRINGVFRLTTAIVAAGSIGLSLGAGGSTDSVSVRLVAPCSVAGSPESGMWIADTRIPGIVKLTEGKPLELAFAGGKLNRSPLASPRAIAVDSKGNLFVADTATCEVYRLKPGEPPIPLSNGAFEIPMGLAVGENDTLYIADMRLSTIYRMSTSGGKPEILARVRAPRGLMIEGDGLIVVSAGPDQLVRVHGDGKVEPIVRGRPFSFPHAVVAAPDREGYLVSDGYAATIWKVSSRGETKAWFKGAPLVRPVGMTRDSSGAVIVADPGAGKAFRLKSPDDIRSLIP